MVMVLGLLDFDDVFLDVCVCGELICWYGVEVVGMLWLFMFECIFYV